MFYPSNSGIIYFRLREKNSGGHVINDVFSKFIIVQVIF